LEQKQRDEAKDRKERGLKWETMVINSKWVLIHMLHIPVFPPSWSCALLSIIIFFPSGIDCFTFCSYNSWNTSFIELLKKQEKNN
jgi:hypothetical protein